MRFFFLILLLLLAAPAYGQAQAGTTPRQFFDRFVAAQNAHDIAALDSLTADGGDFLWITRGTPVWGKAPAMSRFEDLYKGTWHLSPDTSGIRIMERSHDCVQIFAPVSYRIGEPSGPVSTIPFFLNLIIVKAGGDWKLASILPVPGAR